jgi:hypothetical protein
MVREGLAHFAMIVAAFTADQKQAIFNALAAFDSSHASLPQRRIIIINR